MIDLAQLDWRNPAWLLLALQPLLMAVLLHWRRQRIVHYADAALLPWALRGHFATRSSRFRNGVNALAWVLLACAAAGPRLPLLNPAQQQAVTTRHVLNLMLVLDLSPSMQARDIPPQRLQRAKLKLLDLLPRLHGERVGLIVFSGSAGLLMPLTADTRVLPYYLDLAQPALLDTPGSNLAAALELARQTLGQQAARRGAVLLLTDGDATALSGAAGAAALDAARQLDRAGLPLSVLALGSATGATIPLPDGGVLEYDGAPVTSVLDAAGYTTLARLGGGRYASVTDGQADLESLYDDGILKLPANAVPPDPAQAWRELYAWCLLPAWVLLLWVWLPMPKRQVQVALWLFGVMLLAGQIPRSAVAAESDPAQAAYRAYQAGRYVEAQAWYGQMQGYAAAMGGGASAYRRRDYIEAIHQFTQALLRADQTGSRADALYNLGNSYFAVGRLQAAADAYLGVLKLRPHDARAVANLALTAGQRSKPKPAARPTDGVPGRHGEQLGEMRDNGIVPLGMEDSKPKSGMEVDLTPTQRAAAEARLRSAANGQAGRAVVSEQAYQAALKKLELTPDQAEKIQHNLLQQDGRADAAALLPW